MKENSQITKAIAAVVQCFYNGGQYQIKRATKFISPQLVVSGQIKLFKGKFSQKNNVEIVFKVGKPNYAEREFIRLCKKAKDPFPVKDIQVKFVK